MENNEATPDTSDPTDAAPSTAPKRYRCAAGHDQFGDPFADVDGAGALDGDLDPRVPCAVCVYKHMRAMYPTAPVADEAPADQNL